MTRVGDFFLGGFILTFFKCANPGLFFVYFRPFLITISIMQVEIAEGILGIRPGAAGW